MAAECQEDDSSDEQKEYAVDCPSIKDRDTRRHGSQQGQRRGGGRGQRVTR